MSEAPLPGAVLIVEDDEDIRTLVTMAIETELGCTVHTASNGQEAIDLLRRLEQRPCLILLDWMMPVMDGQEVLRHLRADDVLASIPVTIVSAMPGLEGKVGARVMRKPVGLDSLLHLVRQHCSG